MSDGSYDTYLATASTAYGATAVAGAVAVAPVTSVLDSITTTPTATSSSSSDNGVSGGAIAGITIGVLAFFGIAAVAFWKYSKLEEERKTERYTDRKTDSGMELREVDSTISKRSEAEKASGSASGSFHDVEMGRDLYATENPMMASNAKRGSAARDGDAVAAISSPMHAVSRGSGSRPVSTVVTTSASFLSSRSEKAASASAAAASGTAIGDSMESPFHLSRKDEIEAESASTHAAAPVSSASASASASSSADVPHQRPMSMNDAKIAASSKPVARRFSAAVGSMFAFSGRDSGSSRSAASSDVTAESPKEPPTSMTSVAEEDEVVAEISSPIAAVSTERSSDNANASAAATSAYVEAPMHASSSSSASSSSAASKQSSGARQRPVSLNVSKASSMATASSTKKTRPVSAALGSLLSSVTQAVQPAPTASKEREAPIEEGEEEEEEEEEAPEWVKVFDPVSKKPYYYNTQTLVTVWDRPEEYVSEEEDVEEDVEAATGNNDHLYDE